MHGAPYDQCEEEEFFFTMTVIKIKFKSLCIYLTLTAMSTLLDASINSYITIYLLQIDKKKPSCQAMQ